MGCFVRLMSALCCALIGLQATAAQEKRVALVIGNATYKSVAPLPNPKKDAQDITAALTAAGFEVVPHYDLGIAEMRKALKAFEDKASGADWAVVYYAGHGIEVDGINYLVPIDAELKRATDVEDETLALDRVLARMAAAGKLQLVILDACRDNPFKRRMAGAGTRSMGERGLARIEPTHPNVLVAYAARDGQVALDGRAGENSPYARALLKYLAQPGLELGKLFRKVRDDVLADTGGRQRPFEYGSLTGQDLFFKPGAADPRPVVSLQPQPNAAAIEWARVDKSSVAELETFEHRHPASVEAEYARARLKELQTAALVTPAPTSAVTAPKPVEPVLAPHQAIYDLTLSVARGSSSLSAAVGRLTYDLTGSPCEGYTQSTRFVTRLTYKSGKTTVSDLRSSTWEDGLGKRFRFDATQHRDEKLTEATAGAASRLAATADIKVVLTKPKKKTLSLPSRVYFPVQHTIALLQAAEAGKQSLEADYYDGSERGDKVYDTVTTLGRLEAPGSNRGLPEAEGAGPLNGLRAWPVSVAYYESRSEGRSARPIYEIAFLLFENGVSRKLNIDYGDFALRGDLTSITFRAPSKCDPR